MHLSVLNRLAKEQTPREKLGGLLRFVAFWLSIPALVLAAFTLANVEKLHQRGAEYTVRETGELVYVKNCEKYGPISHAGYGYHWGCSVDYGRAGTKLKPFPRQTQSSIFTPADIGKTFAVDRFRNSLYRYHETDRVTWASSWALIILAVFLALGFGYSWGMPRWAVGSLALGIKLCPGVGRKYVEKLLRQGRLEARPYDPGWYPEAAAKVELPNKSHGCWITIAKNGISAKRRTKAGSKAHAWSLRWEQIEKVELTAFYRPDDKESEYPIARVMDLYTIPREWASREPGVKKHWGKMGIQGGARFEYFLSREKALAINTTVAAYMAIRAKGAKP